MKLFKLQNFVKGWIVGDFAPNIIKTKDFEVGVKKYQKGDKEQTHFHKLAEEITVVVGGVFRMGDMILKTDDIIKLEREEVVDFECIEDGTTVIIKTPSVIGDKYLV